MAATFGLFHIAYALKIFCSSERDTDTRAASGEIAHD